MSIITERLVRHGFTSQQAAILEELYPEVQRSSTGASIGLSFGEDHSVLGNRIAQWNQAVVRTADGATDASFQPMATVPIEGGLLDENSMLFIWTHWGFTGSTSTKWFAMDWGGTNVSAPSYNNASYKSAWLQNIIFCNNSLVSQKIMPNITDGPSSGDYVVTTKDTTSTQNIVLKTRWSANAPGESITLHGYSIWHLPGGVNG
jgi:hypothetical protein